jgi:hypothetical protein
MAQKHTLIIYLLYASANTALERKIYNKTKRYLCILQIRYHWDRLFTNWILIGEILAPMPEQIR